MENLVGVQILQPLTRHSDRARRVRCTAAGQDSLGLRGHSASEEAADVTCRISRVYPRTIGSLNFPYLLSIDVIDPPGTCTNMNRKTLLPLLLLCPPLPLLLPHWHWILLHLPPLTYKLKEYGELLARSLCSKVLEGRHQRGGGAERRAGAGGG
eukprot:763224-Hanusia_phi.AAC.4